MRDTWFWQKTLDITNTEHEESEWLLGWERKEKEKKEQNEEGAEQSESKVADPVAVCVDVDEHQGG